MSLSYLRSYERFLVNDSASLIIKEGMKSDPLLVTNLSCAGAGVCGNFYSKPDEIVTIIINSSFFIDKPILRQARVAWVKRLSLNSCEAGLDFSSNKIIF